MACLPAAARKQASRHLVAGPVVQERSAQQYLPFSLSIVHIRTEDCKVLDEACREARSLSQHYLPQTSLLLDRRDVCRVFADVSVCVRRVDGMTGKEPRIEGQKVS